MTGAENSAAPLAARALVMLFASSAFAISGWAEGLMYRLNPPDVPWRTGPLWWVVMGYMILLWLGLAVVETAADVACARPPLPPALRRALARDLARDAAFIAGGSLIVMAQVLLEGAWLAAAIPGALVLLMLTRAVPEREVLEPARSIDEDRSLPATLAAWVWLALGLLIGDRIIPGRFDGTPIYVAWTTMTFSAWTCATLLPAMLYPPTQPVARHVMRMSGWVRVGGR